MDVLSLRRRNGLAWASIVWVVLAASASAQTIRTKTAPATQPARAPVAAPKSGEAEWIWSPAHPKDRVPPAMCLFRKSFDARDVEQAELQIACDDQYELFLNGRLVGKSDEWKLLKKFDILRFLVPGRNVIAVKAYNREGSSAGLIARVTVRRRGGTAVAYSTNRSWRTSLREAPGWDKARFNDANWTPAQSYGEFGVTPPWAGHVAAVDGSGAGRFMLSSDFRVEQVIDPEATGSVIAMAFNEWGEILLSKEGSGLLLVSDANEDGLPETVSTYSDQIKNCQGILPLNGNVFAIAEGHQGAALYRLSDAEQDGKADEVTPLFEFEGELGEHGPHAPVLGPDGLIYLMLGNHTRLKTAFDEASPHRNAYEGDLFDPKYEDPGGHAAGIKAPGGVVVRTDTEGSFLQCVAGGFRNAYDLAFSREGELFTYDSDMEWDVGMPWYRPTRVNHVLPGGEYGWRSGWSVWPDYFVDSLPAAVETGRGSPTGVEFYNHFMFPVRYHNAMFACDWSQGRIIAIRFKPAGGSYQAVAEVFLEGRPLNVTDIAVGPDGWLYFVTGGRGTEGGVYRIVWTGKVPARQPTIGVAAALRQPQLTSAWSRQQVAAIQEAAGEDWERQLVAVARGQKNSNADRVRALDLMQLVGPLPSTDLLIGLSRDAQAEIRSKAAYLLGVHPDEAAGTRLVELLADREALVRRIACEALVRGGIEVPAAPVIKLIADRDRYVSYAARRLLERLPVEQWKDRVLEDKSPVTFVQGASALLIAKRDRESAEAVLDRVEALLAAPLDSLSDDDFVNLLRVTELALAAGNLTAADRPKLTGLLSDEYPTDKEWRMNRELVRLLARLDDPQLAGKILGELRRDIPQSEKMHAALHARYLTHGWTTPQKLALLQFYEQARSFDGGHSFTGYIDNVARDFCANLSELERKQVLSQGTRWPSAALAVLATQEGQPDKALVDQLVLLHSKLAGVDTPAAAQLSTGIVAVLATSNDEQAMIHLRQIFEQRPQRREELAMGLAQQPDGKNWPLLVRALPVIEGMAAEDVLNALAKASEKPESPEPIRQVILLGLRGNEPVVTAAVSLLAHWTGESFSTAGKGAAPLGPWQEWFAKTYPDQPPAVSPQEAEGTRWTYEELLGFLTGPEASHGDASRGAAVFQKASCYKCHRFGRGGESIGPDLTTISQRFHKKEIVEAVLFPSHVVSDQYASQVVVTKTGQTYTGLVAPQGADLLVVLQASGDKVTIRRDEVESLEPGKTSSMPEGLFNTLTLEEIADLFALFESRPSAGGLTRRPAPTGGGKRAQ